jgi:hypothetical protein
LGDISGILQGTKHLYVIDAKSIFVPQQNFHMISDSKQKIRRPATPFLFRIETETPLPASRVNL